jgi:hypothetical protein
VEPILRNCEIKEERLQQVPKKLVTGFLKRNNSSTLSDLPEKKFSTNANDESDVFKRSENKSTMPHFLESVITENIIA